MAGIGRFQKISIPIPRMAFRISEGEGGSRSWNSEGIVMHTCHAHYMTYKWNTTKKDRRLDGICPPKGFNSLNLSYFAL